MQLNRISSFAMYRSEWQAHSYDEPAIKAHFAGRQFVKQLHMAKIYLCNLILKALRTVEPQLLSKNSLKLVTLDGKRV